MAATNDRPNDREDATSPPRDPAPRALLLFVAVVVLALVTALLVNVLTWPSHRSGAHEKVKLTRSEAQRR